jgi:hypothetical protein
VKDSGKGSIFCNLSLPVAIKRFFNSLPNNY